MARKIRLNFQITVFLIILYIALNGFDIEALCPMGGILTFGTQLYQDTMACNMSSIAMFMGFALLIGALSIGKLFCGFICPLGLVSEWLGKIGEKLHLHLLLTKYPDHIFRSFKYILTAIVLYFTITSSELFCRKFDPYFGVASGFSSDVVILWSVIAIFMTIVGSILFKQLWCKYFCPLGALSNIFTKIHLLILPVALFFIIKIFLPDINIILLFLLIAVFGYLGEIGLFNFSFIPFAKITVDQNSCTHCQLCSEACPHGIQVESYSKVTHPDCMMCTDCIHTCQTEKAVLINHNSAFTYVPVLLVIILPLAAYFTSQFFEFKTLEKHWGSYSQSPHITQITLTGIKSVKCYGSSMSLYQNIREKRGIVGIDTYAKSNTVVIYYDSTQINAETAKKILFDPKRYTLRHFVFYRPDSLSVWQVGVQNLFDDVDIINLINTLHHNRHVYGLETDFGEPIITRIFYDSDSTNAANIRLLIDTNHNKTDNLMPSTDFECEDDGIHYPKISTNFYQLRFFREFEHIFEPIDSLNTSVFEIGISRPESNEIFNNLPLLTNHLAAADGIFRLTTSFNLGRTVALIYYNHQKITAKRIEKLVTADTLRPIAPKDMVQYVKNPFNFILPIRTYPFENFHDPVNTAQNHIFRQE